MKKFLTGIVLASFVLMGPVATYADTVSSTTASAQVQSLLTQIQNLQAQIKSLQALQTQMQTAKSSVVDTLQLIRSLREGMSGSDVTALQTILAADPTIYPQGIISGYYGKLTSEAMKKFQKKHGIETVGYVGPKTLKKLNEVIKELGLSKETSKPGTNNGNEQGNGVGNRICIPVGHLIAPGWIKKNGNITTTLLPLCNSKHDDDDDNDDNENVLSTTTPIITNTASASVVVGSAISDVAHLVSGNSPTGTISFNVYGPNDTSCATPLSPAPSSATVNGNGYYNSGNFTTTSVGTYRFIATYSGDNKNYTVHTNCNDTGSSVIVTAVPDTTAPVISSLGATPAATTTSIAWTTDESSTSSVWFGTSSPFVLGSSTFVNLSPLVTSHIVTLSGLATSTTYNYLVVSADASGNKATSTQTSFTTLSGL